MAHEDENSINCIRSVNTQWGALSDHKFEFHSFTLKSTYRGKLVHSLCDVILQNKACPRREEGSDAYRYSMDVTI